MRRKKRKYSNKEDTRHHIVPRSRNGSNDYENIKIVPANYHATYHTLFLNLTPDEVIQYLKDVWFNPYEEFMSPQKWLEIRHPAS